MSKRPSNPDRGMVQLTLPLSELASQKLRSGSLRAKEAVKDALKAALARCGLAREVVADELSRLTGENISIHTINNWIAPAKAERSIPLEYAAALAVITGDVGFLRVALEAAGILVLTAEQAPYYELGRITAEDRARAAARKAIFERLPR
mgnify:CR=1 FL=1